MEASKRQSIWFIVLSALTLTVGVSLLILCKFLDDALTSSTHDSFSNWWLRGPYFMLTAVFGFAAAKIKTDIPIGLYMASNIISMVVSVYFLIVAMIQMALVGLADIVSCKDTSTSIFTDVTDGIFYLSEEECHSSLNNIYSLMKAVKAMLIIGWFLCLAASIVCCSACCCASRPSNMGYVIQSPGVTPYYDYPPAEPAPPRYPPAEPTSQLLEPPQSYESEPQDMTVKENFHYSRMP